MREHAQLYRDVFLGIGDESRVVVFINHIRMRVPVPVPRDMRLLFPSSLLLIVNSPVPQL